MKLNKRILREMIIKSIGKSILAEGFESDLKRVFDRKQSLRKGSRGPMVTALQKFLLNSTAKKETEIGDKIRDALGDKPADGKFGSGTKKAVEIAQKYYNIKKDGIVGAQTATALASFGETITGIGSDRSKVKADSKDVTIADAGVLKNFRDHIEYRISKYDMEASGMDAHRNTLYVLANRVADQLEDPADQRRRGDPYRIEDTPMPEPKGSHALYVLDHWALEYPQYMAVEEYAHKLLKDMNDWMVDASEDVELLDDPTNEPAQFGNDGKMIVPKAEGRMVNEARMMNHGASPMKSRAHPSILAIIEQQRAPQSVKLDVFNKTFPFNEMQLTINGSGLKIGNTLYKIEASNPLPFGPDPDLTPTGAELQGRDGLSITLDTPIGEKQGLIPAVKLSEIVTSLNARGNWTGKVGENTVLITKI
jgi:hypothetical protein